MLISNFGPFIRGLVACQMMFYIMTLLFSYRELFDYTPSDEPINLSKAEINKLKESCERRKNAGVDTSREPTVTTISFQP